MAAFMVLCLASQDALDQQIDAYLRQFQAASEMQQALVLLTSQLTALGENATSPIARRLAEDLRDGMASAAVPALIDALSGRPQGLEPLRAAFRDATTSIAGRIELAGALAQLDDSMSWREGIHSIASDPQTGLDDRLRALGLLLEAEDPRALDETRAIVKSTGTLRPADQRHVVEFLARANTPETREWLETIMGDEALGNETRLAAAGALLRLRDPARTGAARRTIAQLRPGLSVEEPRMTVTEKPWRPSTTPAEPAGSAPAKKEEPEAPPMYKIALGAAAAVVAVLLLAFRRRN